ncbi:MAG: hypothetical protein R3E02_02090 [Blastomonas sp.]
MPFAQRPLTRPQFASRPVIDDYQGDREARYECLVKVLIRNDRFGTASGLLRNYSAHGIGGKASAALEPGDEIEIFCKGFGSFSAIVRWAQGGNFGAVLDEDLSFDETTFAETSFRQARRGSASVFGQARPAARGFGAAIFDKGKA